MKILMLAPFPPPSGGIASWTIRYKEYCEKNNIDLEIINIAMIGDRAKKESNKRNIRDELSRTVRIIVALLRTLRNKTFSVIHINTACSKYGIIRDAICLMIARHSGPVVMHCRCNIEDQVKSCFSKHVFRYIVKKSSKVIVLNNFSKQYVEHMQKGKAIFIPNFVEESMIASSHFAKDEPKDIVMIGHIEKDKGLYEIIDTAFQLPGYNFFLVGAIREVLLKNCVPDNVSFLGLRQQKEIKAILDSADIFLFPSKTEGFSNAVLEAMARGLPIIASNVGANKEMIEDKGGIILEVNCSEHIIRAIGAMRDKRIREKMSIWNINKVRSEYAIETVMNMYLELYKAVVKKGN